jgi:hypothetical protein
MVVHHINDVSVNVIHYDSPIKTNGAGKLHYTVS